MGSQSAQAAFPDIKVPSSTGEDYLYELGGKQYWGELESVIKPLEGFRVTSAAAEVHLAKTRRIFDESKDGDGRGIIHYMLWNTGGDNDALLEKLLALGLHPDLETKSSWRPSHICGLNARTKSAKAISLCRPNLAAKNAHNHTPLEAARRPNYVDNDPTFPEAERCKIRPAVAHVWEEVEKNGFPSIAEMACNKQWFAVQNLCRRRVVDAFKEGLDPFEGRTAVEWAVRYGENSLAEELRYFLDASITPRLQQEAEKCKVAQDASSQIQEAMKVQLQGLQEESKNHREEVRQDIVEIQGRLVCNKQICEEGQESLASQVDTMRKEFLELFNASREHHEVEMKKCQKVQEEMQGELAEKDEELRKMRRTLDRMAKRQKDLEEDVEDLEKSLDEMQTKKRSATNQPGCSTERQDEWK